MYAKFQENPFKFWEKKNKVDFSNIDWVGLQNDFLRNENDTLKNKNLQLTESITHQSKLLDEILLKLSKDDPFEIERIIFENNGKLGYAFHADSVDFIATKINIIPIFKTSGDPLSPGIYTFQLFFRDKMIGAEKFRIYD